MVGHVGDGNFHETILFDGEDEKAKVEKCVHDMVETAIEMDGTCTVSADLLLVMIWRRRHANIVGLSGRAWSWYRQKGLSSDRVGRWSIEVDERHQAEV